MKEKTTISYIGIDGNCDSIYQCDECGCNEVKFHFNYCPECGRVIEK